MIGRFLRFALLLLLASQPAFAASTSEMNGQIAMNRAITEVALAPDGKTVAAVITDPTARGGRPHLWIVGKNAPPRQITGIDAAAPSEESSPVWMADNNRLLYLEHAGDAAAIKRKDLRTGLVETLALSRLGSTVAGGWAKTKTGAQLVAKGFALSPSGALAVWASDAVHSAEKAARKDDQYFFGQSEPVRLYLFGIAGNLREVALPDNVHDVTWSNDGRSLLVITAPASDDLGEQNRLWLIEGDGAPREIRGTAENVQSVSWLPDGRIIYIARCKRDAPIVCRDLFVQGLDGSQPRDLTAGIDGSLVNADKPLVPLKGDILITIARGFDQELARIRLSDGRITPIGSLPANIKSVSANSGQTGFAFIAARQGGILSAGIADARLGHYADLQAPQLQTPEWKPLVAQRIQWQSDAFTIHGLLYMPPAAAVSNRVPLVVDVHGGPTGRFEDIDYPLVRLLLNQGYAVLRVNPRGSFGYGTEFLASLKDDLGGGDYRDIMTGVDTVLAQAPIDPQRLALIGYSYGGTMASFTVGRTDRFKALVAAAPVIDQFSEYGTEASSWYDRWYFGKPWRRVEAAWRQSPLSSVATAHTPMLLLQGESDTIDPPGQSMEMYRALRQEGSPVELMMFPRETHHDLGQNFYGFPSTEPLHGIALRQRVLDFLQDAFSVKSNAELSASSRQ